MRYKLLPFAFAATLIAGWPASAFADDGAMTNKSMSRTIKLPDYGQEIVNNKVPEAEHAFTDMMGFYVPAQQASGLIDPVEYCDIDNQPAPGEDCLNPVETLEVAKPLVNVFLYGPQFEVPNAAFAHRFFDTFAAVSLDDGETWKQTNLSNSADLSSFNIETDHIDKGGDPLPGDHNIWLGDNGSGNDSDDDSGDDGAWHAKNYDTPYTAHCTECHGQGLQGVGSVPSCYSCHEKVWDEETPVEVGPVIYQAEWEGEDSPNKGKLDIEGENAGEKVEVAIHNAVTGELVGTTEAEDNGEFEFEEEFKGELPPCVVYAEYTDNTGETYTGPSVSVVDDETGEPIENCEGLPVDITDYPGGTYNTFHATVGNKTLVAWPSRFCQRGQPAYQMSTETSPDLERLAAVTDFIREGDVDLGVDGLPDFTSPIDGDANDDLYLTDAYGVAGRQGSIDFTDEGYPQAGIVPFGCVWTARGILLPGDDPRTDALESSHMVWTQAERLTSGRRDPNRIEVKGVKDAGFVITWQEDPEGLRPGQGLGPGEGWSGAVAHSQTDVWYSFINWEYFDIVETTDNTTVPINVLDHDLTASGRPQVFVPMAVPMRLTNNAKCNPPSVIPPGGGEEDLYCRFDAAEPFGLRDQCADTVSIVTGPPNNPTETEICVADSFDGIEGPDLPNRANTASTRPRLSLQGWGDEIDKSAWVIVAAEESKGLGRFFFEPDGLDGTFDGYADPCEEDSSLTCNEEIGKNIWYFSFDMGTPDTSAGIDEPNSLVSNLVDQGNLLNQPEVYWETGEFYGKMKTEDMDDYGEYNFEIVNTEIARRSSLLVQSIAKACDSENHLIALPSWKQGPMRQGGPADTMLRRIVAPCEAGVCDAGNPGPGPGGVQPEITLAEWSCDETTGVCTLLVEGTVCVDGNLDPTDIVLLIENATTGDELCVARVDEDYNFTTEFELPSGEIGTCVVPVEEEPCSVLAITGPGQTAGDGQASDPVNVDDLTETEYCVGEPVPEAQPALNTLLALTAAVEAMATDVTTQLVGDSMADNPYAFENMACDEWLIDPDTNPYYPGGVCADPAINLSAVVPDTCWDDGNGASVPCPTVDFTTSTFGIGDTNPILRGVVQGEGNQTRVLTWHQCPSDGVQTVGDITAVTCDTDDRTDDFANLLDQSWYNPLDVSKGHRGFLDGDFVQFLYAWSPNWRLNAKGNDRYELYIRRSFDGANTWTTTPGSFTASDGESYSGDGTVTCESYRPVPGTTTPGARVEPKVCYSFGAGDAEHARNVTQHRSMNITTLDPRYAPAKATIEEGCTDGLFLDDTIIQDLWTCDDTSVDYDSDVRNPSRYFIVFETGDNTTVEVGEAEPLDLFYSRAESFGDDYVVWTETDTGYDADPTSVCYPTVAYDVNGVVGTVLEGSGFCNEFDRMNTRGDTHSSEANLEANPDGSKMYGVWAQWIFDDTGEEVIDSDAMARRIWWLDNYRSDNPDLIYTLPGTNQPVQ